MAEAAAPCQSASGCCVSCLAQNLSPSLGVELVERAYGEDCRPLYRNVRCCRAAFGASPERAHATPRAYRAMIMDEFVIAHTLGWWAKALMLRHSGMCASEACMSATTQAEVALSRL